MTTSEYPGSSRPGHTQHSSTSERKHILMVQGMGNNERGWAEYLSRFARVTLIQLGTIEHVEIWDLGKRLYFGPEQKISSRRKWDEALLGLPTFFRTLVLCRQYAQGAQTALILVGLHSSTLAALVLRALGQTQKVAVVLTDYLPLQGSWLVRLHRRLNGWLTWLGAKNADEVWAVSPRIPTAQANANRFVVPLRVSDSTGPESPRNEIAYIGFPSYDHALDILFDVCKRHRLRLNIIGSSAYLEAVKHLAPADTIFHGIVGDQDRIGSILSRCFCGYAVYRNISPTSYSYYGIPSKTLACLASRTPVVITDAAHFTQNIVKWKVGRVVAPEPAAIEEAILDLRQNYDQYAAAIDRFRTEWNAEVDRFHKERLNCLLGV